MMPGDWRCTACGDHQFAKNTQCRFCGNPKGNHTHRSEGWRAALISRGRSTKPQRATDEKTCFVKVDCDFADVSLCHGFLDEHRCKELCETLLRELPWKYRQLGSAIEKHMTWSMADDDGLKYGYSGHDCQVHPWQPLVQSVEEEVQSFWRKKDSAKWASIRF